MDYIHLVGTDAVTNAGYAMGGAANDMLRAASQIAECVERHRLILEQWMERLEALAPAPTSAQSEEETQ